MKAITLAALALFGGAVVAGSASAAPISPGLTTLAPDELSNVVPVHERKWRRKKFRRRFHDDDDFGFHFGFGIPFFALGFGHPHHFRGHDVDCIGRWHRHRTRWHCHGQLVWD
jgi:hypothetical protein